MDCPTIIFHILRVIRGADLGCGGRLRILGVGASVARARAAKVSIIKFTQSNCTAVNTELSDSEATAETKVNTTAVTLTVSWNCTL